MECGSPFPTYLCSVLGVIGIVFCLFGVYWVMLILCCICCIVGKATLARETIARF